ncbi:MAG: putative RNA uridine N3 methyltransferase, partial [Desulfurococcaceae archaeon]
HQVARWSSIFGVREVVFYREPSTEISEHGKYKKLIEDHWRYFFTPPYLRRALVPLTSSLKYVGLLPPIRLKAFNVGKRPRDGEHRLGYVFIDSSGEHRALIGDDVVYRASEECKEHIGISPVLVVDRAKRLVKCVNRTVYLGPRLSFANSLKEAVNKCREASKCLIATDKTGSYPELSVLENACGSDITILFGSPKYDLFEISSQESFALNNCVDCTWNTVPNQEVVSVRTEEALLITLGVINALLRGL